MDESSENELFYTDFKALSVRLQQSGKLSDFSGSFGKLKSDLDRVLFIRNLEGISDIFDIGNIPKVTKSSATAQHLRNEGNKFFKNGQYEEALSLYNDSVAYSLNPAEDTSGKNYQSLAFSNRSAALFYLKEYEICLIDIDNAIQAGYAADLQYKLYDRKGKCHHALNSTANAKLAFETAKSLLDKAKLDNKKKETFLKEFQKNIDECSDLNCKNNSEDAKKQEKVLPKVAAGANATYTSLTSVCKVAYTPNQGRFLVADRDIKPGEVILVEKPYASILLPEQYSNHCHHCFKRCLAPLVCRHCPIARYCSPTCRDRSWDTYHKHECDSLDIIHRSGVGKFGHLALRTVTVSGLQFLLEHRKNMSNEEMVRNKECEGCGEDDRYIAEDYNTIYHLVTHDTDRPVHDLFRRSAMAVFLTKCLERASFFAGIDTEDKEDVLVFVGGLLLSHLQLLPCNAHEIAELELDKSSVASSVPTEIGAGIYATLSLFNHSCDPTVNRNFYGDQCVVRAIKTIKKGQEVSDNYGAVYAMQTRIERQQKLKPQYFFECACEACVNNWPLYPHIEHNSPTFKCSHCLKPLPRNLRESDPCGGCSQVQKLDKMKKALEKSTKLYQEAFETLLEGDISEALPAFLRHIEVMDELLVLPWREYNNCQEAIKQCFSIMGNCHIVSA